jgi:hypothetical protein
MSLDLSETFSVPEVEPWADAQGYEGDPMLEYENARYYEERLVPEEDEEEEEESINNVLLIYY